MTQNEKIINAVTDFVRGGDESNVEKLNNILHQDFRNTQNGFFAEKGVVVFDKEKYLSLIRDKVFGGNPREMEIAFIEEAGNIAVVKASLKSSELTFTSFISLVADESGNWKVIENFPFIQVNK